MITATLLFWNNGEEGLKPRFALIAIFWWWSNELRFCIILNGCIQEKKCSGGWNWVGSHSDERFAHRAESFVHRTGNLLKVFEFLSVLNFSMRWFFNLSCDFLFCYLCIDERINFVRVAVCSSSIWWRVCEVDQWADKRLPQEILCFILQMCLWRLHQVQFEFDFHEKLRLSGW